jgi:hypothetical protein
VAVHLPPGRTGVTWTFEGVRRMAFDPRLGTAFNFDAADLECNRGGGLSPDQEILRRNTLRAYRRRLDRGGLLLGLALVAAAVAAGVGVAKTPGGDATSGVIAAVILLGILCLATEFRRRGRRTTDTIEAGGLTVAEGTFSWNSDLNASWWGHVGDACFSLTRDQEELLTTGAPYRVYYLPAGDAAWLLAIERIEEKGPE